MLPALQVQVVDMSDASRNRIHLQTLTHYVRALRDAINGCKKAGQNTMTQGNSLPMWEQLLAALESAEQALALVTAGGAKT